MKKQELTQINQVLNIRQYPYPIAHAWLLANNNELNSTVRHINAIACFYQCIRLVAIAYAGWYVYRMEPNSKVEKALIELKRPMMGHWYSFIKSCMKNIFFEKNKSFDVLYPLIESISKMESIKWDSGQIQSSNKKKIALSPLAWFINHRNIYHGHFTTLTDKEAEKALEVILPKLESIISSLDCFINYSLIHKDLNSGRVFELNAEYKDKFPEIDDYNKEIESIYEFDSTEVVAMIYPESELVIPLTFFVTRENNNDKFDGLIKFNTSEVAGEPLLFEGMNIKERQVVYLGSGTRRMRSLGFDFFDTFFKSREELFKTLHSNSNIIDYLENQLHGQLAQLREKKYQPETYVRRESEDYFFNRVSNIAETKPVILVLGNSGSGKTSLFCNLASKISSKKGFKHQVSFQVANRIHKQTLNLEYSLANNLGYKDQGDSFGLLELLNYWLKANNQHNVKNPFLWIFWDGLNEGENLEEVTSWIINYSTIIDKFNKNNNATVRLIASCRLEPWNELMQRKNKNSIDFSHFQEFKDSSNTINPFFLLEKFTKKEVALGYKKFQQWAKENNQNYCPLGWKELTEEQKEIIRLPLNSWLFHSTFSSNTKTNDLTLNTYNLWMQNISNLVSRNHFLYLSFMLMGKIMWHNGNSVIDVDDFESSFRQEVEKETASSLKKVGMELSEFQSLPFVAQQAIIETQDLKTTDINPIELLDVTGLVIVNEGTIKFTFQTLSETIATIVVWEDLFPNYRNSKCDVDVLVSEIEKEKDFINLNIEIKKWQDLSSWQNGRTALFNIWATRAEIALKSENVKEAIYNLNHLQLRAQSDRVINLIKANNKIVNPTEKLRIDSILFDMVHIQGKYLEASKLIKKALDEYKKNQCTDELLILELSVRHIHHRMFFEPVAPLWFECKSLLNTVDDKKYPKLYGDVLFMLGGNLGALKGDYEIQRRTIYKVIRHAVFFEDEYLLCRGLRKYVDYLRIKGKFIFANFLWEFAWKVSEKSQKTRQGIYLLCVYADMQRQQKDYEKAILNFKEAMELSRESCILGWVGHNNLGLSETYLELGDIQKSRNYLLEAKKNYTLINQIWGTIQTLITEYRIEKNKNGKFANELFEKALHLCDRYGYEKDRKFLIEERNSKVLTDRCLMFL